MPISLSWMCTTFSSLAFKAKILSKLYYDSDKISKFHEKLFPYINNEY